MGTTTMSSREFNQRTHAAKVAADSGPVIVTDRGAPRHVLLSYDAYRQLSGTRSLADLIGNDRTAAEADLPQISLTDHARPAELD
jgi:prevent-host-death family protein